MPSKPGDRVYAVESYKDGVVRAYGPGVYAGSQMLPDGTKTCFGVVGKDGQPAFLNPKIDLDNGDVVWGCQCWWGPEEMILKEFEGEVIEIVPVPGKKEEDV